MGVRCFTAIPIPHTYYDSLNIQAEYRHQYFMCESCTGCFLPQLTRVWLFVRDPSRAGGEAQSPEAQQAAFQDGSSHHQIQRRINSDSCEMCEVR